MLDIPFINLIIIISSVILTVFLLYIMVRIIRSILRRESSEKHIYEKDILLVRVSKEKPKDESGEGTLQSLQEDIAAGESIFSLIGGMKANPEMFKSWMTGAHNSFSFEIVAHQNLIKFYLAIPKHQRRFIEQEVYAHYPNATIEEISDYNIFSPASHVKSAVLKLGKSGIFPIRTYKKMEIDPLDSLLNTLAKLRENEGAAIQIIVRSAHKSWRRRAKRIVSEVRKGKSLSEAMKASSYGRVFSGAGKMADVLTQKKKEEVPAPNQRLTPIEEETLKSIEEKMSKAGLDVNIRIVVSSDNEGSSQVYLDNIVDVFNQYTIFEYGNGFKKLRAISGDKAVSDFIFRRFSERNKMVLNTEELASIFHFPLPHNETPNIYWLTAKKAAASPEVPSTGMFLGENIFRGVVKPIHIKRADRRRHMYMIGKSGTGKSNLLALMARQDIINGEGVCVVDPHGDLIEDVLAGIPKERADDVIHFAPSDIQRPIGLNLLEYDERYPEQKTFVINEMIKIFDKL